MNKPPRRSKRAWWTLSRMQFHSRKLTLQIKWPHKPLLHLFNHLLTQAKVQSGWRQLVLLLFLPIKPTWTLKATTSRPHSCLNKTLQILLLKVVMGNTNHSLLITIDNPTNKTMDPKISIQCSSINQINGEAIISITTNSRAMHLKLINLTVFNNLRDLPQPLLTNTHSALMLKVLFLHLRKPRQYLPPKQLLLKVKRHTLLEWMEDSLRPLITSLRVFTNWKWKMTPSKSMTSLCLTKKY